MILCLIATVLVLAIAYFQSRQGLFSALIFAILTLLCATIAVNWYQPLSRWLLFGRHQLYSDAICLVLLFTLPLFSLRLLMDWLVSGNVILNRWVDLVGGGLIGLLIGILHVGIFTLALQMLPIGPSILGYQAFDAQLRPTAGVWVFQPDRATLALTTGLAEGTLSTDASFTRRHDDLLLEVFCQNYRPEKTGLIRDGRRREEVTSRIGRLDSNPGDIQIGEVLNVSWDVAKSWNPEKLHPLLAEAMGQGQRVFLVRVRVSKDATELPGQPAANWWLLPGPHFRMVSSEAKSYYPVGYLTHLNAGEELSINEAERRSWPRPAAWVFIGPDQQDDRGVFRVADLRVERQWDGTAGSEWLTVDWIYLLPATSGPTGLAPELPAYMVFRRGATAEVDPGQIRVGAAAQEAFEAPRFDLDALRRKLSKP